jgi:hypothetical protein
MLRPVLWVSLGGVVLIMRAAVPLSEMMPPGGVRGRGGEMGLRCLHCEDGCPFAPKESDWGWYKGRRVAPDYSAPTWGNH